MGGSLSGGGGAGGNDLLLKDFDLESMRGGVNDLKAKVLHAERER